MSNATNNHGSVFRVGDAAAPFFPIGRIFHTTNEDDLTHSYLQTCEINAAAGNYANAGWEAADHQIKIIDEEFNRELVPAIAARDINALRDGLAYTLFTLIGLAHRLDLPFIEDLAEVVRSNLTKFDYNKHDADATLNKYGELGIDVYQKVTPSQEGARYVTFSARDQIDRKGKKYIAHKWLKSHNFQDVNFKPLLLDNRLALDPPPITPLATSQDLVDAAELLTASAPMETLSQLLLTYVVFRHRFQYMIAAHVKGYFAYAQAHDIPIWHTHDSVSDGETHARIVLDPDRTAVQIAHTFVATLLCQSPLHTENISTEDMEGWMQELLPIAHLDDIDGNALYLATVNAFSNLADRVAYQRAFSSLGQYAFSWHESLAQTFEKHGVCWTSAQLASDLMLWRFFRAETIDALLDGQSTLSHVMGDMLLRRRGDMRLIFTDPL